jgi:hypothetical protein
MVVAAQIRANKHPPRERIKHRIDPTTRRQKAPRNAEKQIRHINTSHSHHSTHSDGQREQDVDGGVHDHELRGARELRGVVVDDAAEAAAQMEEDVAVDGDGAEFDDEDPEVV